MADSATDRTVLAIVDRIYEAVERPERWPETIRALGDFIGGRRDIWDLNLPTGDLAALWEDGRVFNGENLRLITPHLDRALRLQNAPERDPASG